MGAAEEDAADSVASAVAESVTVNKEVVVVTVGLDTDGVVEGSGFKKGGLVGSSLIDET